MRGYALAADYLAGQGLRCVDMMEILRRDGSSLRYAQRDGVLLFDQESGAWLLSARSETALKAALVLIPTEARLAVCHEEECLRFMQARLGLEPTACFQSVWTGKNLPVLPEFQGELRRLGQEWAGEVSTWYDKSFGDLDYICGAIERGMLGLFVEERLAGFVGFHDEGSIGMLEVLSAYRRRGYGRVLLLAAVREALEQGKYAFGQVFCDNTPSLHLQHKSGMEVCREKIFWLMEK